MEHEGPFMGAFGLGQRSQAAPTAWRTPQVQGRKTFIDSDAFGTQGGHETCAWQTEGPWLELEAELVVGRLTIFPGAIAKRPQPRYAMQRLFEEADGPEAVRVALGEAVELR